MSRTILGLSLAAVLALPASTAPAAPVWVNPLAGPPTVLTDVSGRLESPPARPTENARATTPTSPASATNSIGYLVSKYSISVAEAERRLRLQTESAALAADLAQRHPDEYAGMWMDQAGGGVLRVAMTRPGLVPATPGVAAVPAQRSLRQLELEAKQMRAGGQNAVVDVRTNRVVVAPGAVEELKCDPLHCAGPTIRGGIRIDVPRVDGSVGGCTTGYLLRSAVNGQIYLLTAGHCVLGSTHSHVDKTWHEYLGARTPVTVEDADTRLTENVVDLGHDYAVMPFQPGADAQWFDRGPFPRPIPVPHRVNHHGLRITGVTHRSNVQVGWVVCASGSGYTPEPGEVYVDSGAGRGYVPGTHCGEVTAVGNRISVRICARRGDSGGPLFTETDGRALGILSGGDARSGPCVPGDTEQNHYSPLSTVLERVSARTGNAYQFELLPSGAVPLVPPRP